MFRWRRPVQILFLAFFCYLFVRTRYPNNSVVAVDFFLRLSPLRALFGLFDPGTLGWPVIWSLLIAVSALFLGRAFCSWICPLGAIIEITGEKIRLTGKTDQTARPTPKIEEESRGHSDAGREAPVKKHFLRSVKFLLLATSLVLAAFSFNLWGIFDPISICCRVFTIVIFPILGWAVTGLLRALTALPVIGRPFLILQKWTVKYLFVEQHLNVTQGLEILVFFLAILGLSAISARFWCRNICPAGAFLGFLSKWDPTGRKVSEACVHCRKCVGACPMEAIPDDEQTNSKIECTKCGTCQIVCPGRAEITSFSWVSGGEGSQLDVSRRHLLISMGGGVLAASLGKTAQDNPSEYARIIRPPGALPEKEFLNRCIRCLNCVRMCQSNGACLQPDADLRRLDGLWAPRADMRTGYCEFNCNLCGLACPTQAIAPLPLIKKKRFLMGRAFFDKNFCIPYVYGEDCLVCEEHCPTPEKAIKFESRAFIRPSGEKVLVKFPYVDRQACIGCGICENKCPLPGLPGVFVLRAKSSSRPQ